MSSEQLNFTLARRKIPLYNQKMDRQTHNRIAGFIRNIVDGFMEE